MRAETRGLSNRPVKYRENLADLPIRIGASYRIKGGGASPPRMGGGRLSRRATQIASSTDSGREREKKTHGALSAVNPYISLVAPGDFRNCATQ